MTANPLAARNTGSRAAVNDSMYGRSDSVRQPMDDRRVRGGRNVDPAGHSFGELRCQPVGEGPSFPGRTLSSRHVEPMAS